MTSTSAKKVSGVTPLLCLSIGRDLRSDHNAARLPSELDLGRGVPPEVRRMSVLLLLTPLQTPSSHGQTQSSPRIWPSASNKALAVHTYGEACPPPQPDGPWPTLL